MSTDQRETMVTSPAQLAKVLRGHRKHQGLTQNALAARIGLTQASVSFYETDANRLNVENLFKVLSELHLELVLREKPSEDMPESEW